MAALAPLASQACPPLSAGVEAVCTVVAVVPGL
jgi:hypothetical protein